jgi:hypothetical protein
MEDGSVRLAVTFATFLPCEPELPASVGFTAVPFPGDLLIAELATR